MKKIKRKKIRNKKTAKKQSEKLFKKLFCTKNGIKLKNKFKKQGKM